MGDIEIRVVNYLDMHVKINNNKQIEVFSINKLKEAFPEIDEFSLKTIESEWRKARQGMINLKF